jgi:hypothetical protein
MSHDKFAQKFRTPFFATAAVALRSGRDKTQSVATRDNI